MNRSNQAEIQRLARLILQQQRDGINTTTDARTLSDLVLKLDPEDRPMVEWCGLADAMAPEHRASISSEVADRAVHLARFSAYLNSRYTGRSHLQAVNAQNWIAKTLRRAFGFTYPQSDITF